MSGTHLVCTLLMVGVILFVQIVHYPLMDRVGADRFVHYEGLAEGPAHDIWAYDPGTGEWTMLLADVTG